MRILKAKDYQDRIMVADAMFIELDKAHQKHDVYAMEPLTLLDGFTATAEELGEVAEALHEKHINDGVWYNHKGYQKDDARHELVQLGSLCMAMIMKIDRGDRLA